jgi:hypothetical protein
MLATLVFYWFLSLPGVITGLLLLQWFKRAHESEQAKERVRATSRKK